MRNPWLDIPLADYEGHMRLPEVAQAELLAEELAAALEKHAPASVAVLGCAGGNGFERISPEITGRVVGVDLNPAYVDAARVRFGGRLPGLELIVGDIESDGLAFAPVDLVFAGLVFEYVDIDRVLARIPPLLTAGGALVTVLQLPSEAVAEVTPSRFESLKTLSQIMHLVPPRRLRDRAAAYGLHEATSRTVRSRGGKSFRVQTLQLVTLTISTG